MKTTSNNSSSNGNVTVTAAMHDKFMINANGEQTCLSSFADPEDDFYKSAKYVSEIATNAHIQLCASLAENYGDNWQSVLWSWGAERATFVRWRLMPALAMRVHGYEHDGWLIISLDEGRDVYEMECATANWVPVDGKRNTEVYCDQLGEVADRMIETGDKSKAEYDAQVEQDYPELCAAKKSGVKHVVIF